MLEKHLKVDTLFRLTTPNVPQPAFNNGDFVEQQPVWMSLQTTGIIHKDRSLKEVAAPPQKHGFQWLAYFGGAITHVPLASKDVLTGPMSGCWVVIYTDGGVEHVGHVGTVGGNAAATTAAKDAWKNLAVNQSARVVGGFKPDDELDLGQVKAKDDDGALRAYGLVTANKELYAVFVRIQEYKIVPKGLVGTHDEILRIAQVTKVNTASPNKLQTL